MDVDWGEVRRGVRETRGYLLAHHARGERYRCHTLRLPGRNVDVCARCTGIYPGILLGVAAHLLGLPGTALLFVAILPLPALLDWTLTAWADHRGSNAVRTATGGLLGFAYGSGLVHVTNGRLLGSFAVAALYAVLAGTAMYALDTRGS